MMHRFLCMCTFLRTAGEKHAVWCRAMPGRGGCTDDDDDDGVVVLK